jgi:hypothetical protein
MSDAATSAATSAASDPMAAINAAQAALNNATSAANAAAHAASSSGSINAVTSQFWSPELIRFLTVSILMFTFGALILGAILLWREKADGNQILRVFGVISIIGISALLLIVGFSNSQLTPIVGLFGAIAGYLLGKDAPKEP